MSLSAIRMLLLVPIKVAVELVKLNIWTTADAIIPLKVLCVHKIEHHDCMSEPALAALFILVRELNCSKSSLHKHVTGKQVHLYQTYILDEKLAPVVGVTTSAASSNPTIVSLATPSLTRWSTAISPDLSRLQLWWRRSGLHVLDYLHM